MNITKYVGCVLSLLLVGLVLPAFGEGKPTDEKFDLLQVGTETYTNVTFTKATGTDLVCFMHSRGISTVKVTDLPEEAQIRLGFKEAAKSSSGSEFSAKASEQWNKAMSQVDLAFAKELTGVASRGFSGDPAARNAMLIVLGVFAVFYLFFCYCTKLICDKAGKPAGLLVWFPLLQWIPMFRAAGMSPLWILGLFIPVVNTLALIIWAFKIAAARGKHWMVGVLLILPLTDIFAFLYLAFADRSKAVEEDKPKAKRPLGAMKFETA